MKLLPVTRKSLCQPLSDAGVVALIENAPKEAASNEYGLICENNEICLHPEKKAFSPLIRLILKPGVEGTDLVLTFAMGKFYQILLLVLSGLYALLHVGLIVLDLICKIHPNLLMILPLLIICLCLIAALIISNCANNKAAAKVLDIVKNYK